MFLKNIKNMYQLAKAMNTPEDIKKIKAVSPRSGYGFNEEDRERAEIAKQNRADLKRQEFELKKQELEIEKLTRLQDMEIRKAELAELRAELTGGKETGGSMEDILMTQLMSKFLGGAPQPAPAQQNLQQFTQAPLQPAPAEPIAPQEQPQTRFKDEELKQHLPNLLTPQQIQALKQLNLNDDELLQLGDVIKSY